MICESGEIFATYWEVKRDDRDSHAACEVQHYLNLVSQQGEGSRDAEQNPAVNQQAHAVHAPVFVVDESANKGEDLEKL